MMRVYDRQHAVDTLLREIKRQGKTWYGLGNAVGAASWSMQQLLHDRPSIREVGPLILLLKLSHGLGKDGVDWLLKEVSKEEAEEYYNVW